MCFCFHSRQALREIDCKRQIAVGPLQSFACLAIIVRSGFARETYRVAQKPRSFLYAIAAENTAYAEKTGVQTPHVNLVWPTRRESGFGVQNRESVVWSANRLAGCWWLRGIPRIHRRSGRSPIISRQRGRTCRSGPRAGTRLGHFSRISRQASRRRLRRR